MNKTEKEKLNRQLFEAAEKYDVEAVKKAIENGADVNAKNSEGETILILAAYDGTIDIVELAILKGADVNAKKDGGYTALDIAESHYYADIMDLLKKHGGIFSERHMK